ncbi:MAG: hypothetical protein U0871_11345 [Gemmataceae bacterium]
MRPLKLTLLTVALVCSSADRVNAGWLSIKNDTRRTLLIQEAPATPGGKPGRCIRLLPGECFREYQTKPGEKRLNLLDPDQPTKPLSQAKLAWGTADLSVRIRTENATTRLFGPAGVKPEAVIDLAKVAPPVKR